MKSINLKIIGLIIFPLVISYYFLTDENPILLNAPVCNDLATTNHISEEYEGSKYPRENNLKVLKTDQIRELPENTEKLRKCGAIFVLSNKETKPVFYTVTKSRTLEFMVLRPDGSVEYANH